MMIALYVDDLLHAAISNSQTVWIKQMLIERFDMKELGTVKVCLELEITRNQIKEKLQLTQQSYMRNIVKHFGLTNSKPVQTPMEEPNNNTDSLEVITD